jgi:type VI secretion system protein ImpJ
MGPQSVAGTKQIPEAIQWQEGMLLSPEHFQQLVRRSEELLYFQLSSLAPYFWGVRTREIDQPKLVGGMFSVLSLEAIMPDGLVVSYEKGEKPEIVEIQLLPQHEPITIHLAVPARTPMAIKGDLPRYQDVEGEAVVDEETGEKRTTIPRLKPRLELLAGDVPPSKYVSFPLAQVEYTNTGFKLTDFVPPTPVISTLSPIWKMCSETAAKIREGADSLARQVPLLLETRSQIQCLVAALPHFEVGLATGLAHPYELYKAFCLLAGNLAGLGNNVVPPQFKPYNHRDLRATFIDVQAYAWRMMREGVHQDYQEFRFALKNGMFILDRFRAEWKGRKLFLAMRGASTMSGKDVTDWGTQCRIGSASVMQSLHDQRVPGAKRDVSQGDETLSPPLGTILFSVEDSDVIRPDQSLLVVDDGGAAGKMRPTEVTLFVKKSVAELAVARQASG